ncbi:MAG: hypothetical protein Q7K21_01805 [Elusimicrobiota bacterium]|nr:hypothetical protein [Elusimicrobiota bacterium]
MKNQDIKSGLFGGIGENMVAFELAKRNWYVYKPYFDTRIDFIAQKFVCKKCFSDWESKHIISCFNNKCVNYLKELNYSSYIKTRKCLKCGYVFDKYAENMDCPDCKTNMIVVKAEKSGQRNYQYRCPKCKKEFTSQTRDCVKCGSENCSEYPICAKCKNEIKPKNEKCINPRCNSEEYALIIRTIQVKSSHEEESETIGFNFKIQDLIEDERHFLVVYSRTFEEYKEKHNFWVMSVNEFKKVYLKDTASALIYQNARMHPPKKESDMYFD